MIDNFLDRFEINKNLMTKQRKIIGNYVIIIIIIFNEL